MKEVFDYIRSCGVYYLATVDNDQPKLRPMGCLEIIDDKLYILTGKSKNVSKQIEKNNKVEIVASKGENWVRVTCKLIRDDRVEIKKAMLDKNPHLRVAYDENDNNTEVLYMKDAEAVFNSFTEPPRKINF